MHEPTSLPTPSSRWGRVRYAHDTLLRLVMLDRTGYFARHRVETELRATAGRKAALAQRVAPLHSLRYRIAMRLVVDLLRLEIALSARRSPSCHSLTMST